MHQLNDRDMAYDMLYGAKDTATLTMTAIMESASPRCREVFHRIHDDHLQDQWRIYQLLHRKGEYRASQADRQEISGVRQRMEHLRQSHERPSGHQSFNGNSGGRWDDRGWNEPSAVGAAAGAGYGTGGVSFEPDRGLPAGTRFESEQGWGEPAHRSQGDYESGRTYATAGVGTGNATEGAAAGASYGGRAGWSTGAARTTGTWQEGDARSGSGSRQPEGTARTNGEGNWGSEETRRSTRRY
jgi:hypothetical protein